MKQKKKTLVSILQIAILSSLLSIRLWGGISNQYMIYFVEGFIALILLAFGENILISLVVLPFIITYYISLYARYIRFKSNTKRDLHRNAVNELSKSQFNSLVTNQKEE